MNIKKKVLKEKRELFARYKIIESYLIDCIANGDKGKENELKEIQMNIDELDNIIKFLEK
ncbi:MAG: hypothetical protein ACTSQA_08215 [Candidatus Heimdallarchaeaceae archaeon]